jgi:hypothetical protein
MPTCNGVWVGCNVAENALRLQHLLPGLFGKAQFTRKTVNFEHGAGSANFVKMDAVYRIKLIKPVADFSLGHSAIHAYSLSKKRARA